MTEIMTLKLKVNLNALKENYLLLKKLASKAECGSVVKANAYGLGVIPIVRTLRASGCRKFFVATLDEAVDLRKEFSDIDIFILNGISKISELKYCLEYNLIPVLNTIDSIILAKDIPSILHIDTGMNRLGIDFKDLDKIKDYKNFVYIMSHLACADIKDDVSNQKQYDKFIKILEYFPKIESSFANSAAIFLGEKYHFDLVRPGCALYGINPTPDLASKMHKVVELTAQILSIRHIDSGDSVGYGAAYKAKDSEVIATIAIGYADGFLRSSENKGYCVIKGIKCPIIGRVSMDLITANITEIKDIVNIGDEVEIIGSNITVDEVAKYSGTIGYEIFTRLSCRCQRLYV